MWKGVELGAAPDFQHLRGWEGHVRSPRIRLGRGQAFHLFKFASQTNTSWLELILHPLVLGQATGDLGLTWLTTPTLRRSHHLTPYSILCDSPWGLHPNGTFSWDSQVEVPKSTKVSRFWILETLNSHSSSPQPPIGTRFESKLYSLSRSFQRRIALLNRTSGSGWFSTFSGRESNCQFYSHPFFCP
jgi:hypothetical protein